MSKFSFIIQLFIFISFKINKSLSKITNYQINELDKMITYNNSQNGTWINEVWIPNINSTYRIFDSIDASKCLNNKNIILVGNSISRHMYVYFKSILNGVMTDISSDVDRRAEKLYYTKFLAIENNPQCNKLMINKVNPNKKYKSKQKNDNCPYNSNHLKDRINSNWAYNGNSGNLSFIWTYDWYLPAFSEILSKENVIMLPNAGLNHKWAYSKGWDSSDLVYLKEQFPLLWKVNIHSSSMLVYRQNTHTCDAFDNELMEQNKFIFDYTRDKMDENHKLINLEISTRNLMHYLDCNHHPGNQTMVHFNMILTEICPKELGVPFYGIKNIT